MRNFLSVIVFALTIGIAFSSVIDSSLIQKSEPLTEDIEILKTTAGKEMDYYEITVPKTWKKNDLIVESKLTQELDLMTSPYIIMSLEPLNKNERKSQWVCNQLGEEVCFIPAKYLKENDKVYLGVFCKECEYNLKYTFSDVTLINLGDTKTFHLKSGDSKFFDLIINSSSQYKDYINILSFNLRMAKYEMKVEIIALSKDDKVTKPANVNANVNSNWIGGQQAIIYPNNFNFENGLISYTFRITVTAFEDGIFNLEATSGNTIISLSETSLRFDTVSKETPLCYVFDNSSTSNAKKSKNFIVHVKSINGDITVIAQEDKLPQNDDYLKKFVVQNEKEVKVEIESKNNTKWFLCFHSEDHSYYTVHIFTEEKKQKIEDYKNLLFSNFF